MKFVLFVEGHTEKLAVPQLLKRWLDLDRLYTSKMSRRYKKTTDGTNLFRALDPAVAYTKCPNLKLLLDDMLQLAQEAGL